MYRKSWFLTRGTKYELIKESYKVIYRRNLRVKKTSVEEFVVKYIINCFLCQSIRFEFEHMVYFIIVSFLSLAHLSL